MLGRCRSARYWQVLGKSGVSLFGYSASLEIMPISAEYTQDIQGFPRYHNMFPVLLNKRADKSQCPPQKMNPSGGASILEGEHTLPVYFKKSEPKRRAFICYPETYYTFSSIQAKVDTLGCHFHAR